LQSRQGLLDWQVISSITRMQEYPIMAGVIEQVRAPHPMAGLRVPRDITFSCREIPNGDVIRCVSGIIGMRISNVHLFFFCALHHSSACMT
jgi:hypothetical protein